MSHEHGAARLESGKAADREKVTISFAGEVIPAIEGEPIAVALLAAGYRVLRTMPKSGEARGGYCFTGRCADCLLVVEGVGQVRACMTPVRPGMHVSVLDGLGPAESV